MATTYTLINSSVLTGSQASVTFSSIPSTYTDLVLKYSARNLASGAGAGANLEFNASAGSAYSYTRLVGTGSGTSSYRVSSTSTVNLYLSVVADGATSNIFSNSELYIPSYTASQYKQFSNSGATEDNAVDAYRTGIAGLWSDNSAITSIKLTSNGGGDFMSGSSFWLYGIKNS